MNQRGEKISGMIKEYTASYIGKESNNQAIITVTNTNVSDDLKKATIFITVLPEEKENDALYFVKRNLGEIREYLKKNMSIKSPPFLDVVIDRGEKERRKIDELLKS